MRKFAALFALLLALLLPAQSWAAFVHNETVQGTSTTTISTTALAAMNLASGSLVVGAIKWEPNGGAATAISTVTDTAGNTYVLGTVKSNSGSNGEPRVQPFWCLSATANATNVITITLNAAAPWKYGIAVEVTTAGATKDVEANGEATSGTAPVTAAFSTADAAEYVFSFIGGYTSQTSPGFTSPTVGGNAGTLRGTCTGVDSCAFDRITSSAISGGTAGATLNVSTRWTIVTVAFTEGGGGGGGATPRNLTMMGMGQ